MKTIWKFTISSPDFITVKVPKFSQFLDVQMQRDTPCFWFAVNDDNELEQRTFRIVGTGHRFDELNEHTYLSTFQMNNDELVWHLFEKKTKRFLRKNDDAESK